jgi:hypothetical protein
MATRIADKSAPTQPFKRSNSSGGQPVGADLSAIDRCVLHNY